MTPQGRRTPLPSTHRVRTECNEAGNVKATRAELIEAADKAALALGLACTARTLLLRLAACYGEQNISQGLMVWPSNQSLADKTGLSERALRYGVTQLRTLGLVLTHDSPNGKRFARKRGNTIVEVFGFDLKPLYVRAREFAEKAALIELERRYCRDLAHDINARRKDIEAIRDMVQDGCPAFAATLSETLTATRLPRSKSTTSAEFQALLVTVESAYASAERYYADLYEPKENAACGGKECRQKESKTESSIETCQSKMSGVNTPQHNATETASGGIWAFKEKKRAEKAVLYSEQRVGKKHSFLLEIATWRAACPDFVEASGPLRRIEDVASAGPTHRASFRASENAHAEAQRLLGPSLYGLFCAWFYQTIADDELKPSGKITNPGGLFRSKVRELAAGALDLELELLAMKRRRERKPGSAARPGL